MTCGYIRPVVLIALILSVLLPLSGVSAQGGEELSKTFTSRDGRISFDYPAGWMVDETQQDVIMLSSDPALLEYYQANQQAPDPFPTDAVMLMIFPPELINFFVPRPTPETLQEFSTRFYADTLGIEDEVVEETTFGNNRALQAFSRSGSVEGILVTMEIGDEFMIMSTIAAIDQYAGKEETFTAILNTFEYAADEATLTYISEDKTLSVDYPGDWFATDVTDGIVAISNQEVSAGHYSQETLPPGCVMIYILPPQALPEIDADNLTGALRQFESYMDLEGEFSDPDQIILGRVKTLRANLRNNGDEWYLLVSDHHREGYLYFMFRGAIFDLTVQEDLIMSILDTVVYTPIVE